MSVPFGSGTQPQPQGDGQFFTPAQVHAPDSFFDILRVQPRNPISSPHMDGTERRNIYPGLKVSIVQKQDQPTGALTDGIVQDILTSSPTHPRGIKVRLTTGEVGRVQIIQP